MTSTTEHDAASLGAKLDSLSLTDGEAALLDALLAAGTGRPEVEGFGTSGSFHATEDIWRTGSYADKITNLARGSFKAELQGFTAPGDVAGRSQP